MNTTTDTTAQPSPESLARHPRRRTLLSLAIVAAIAFGGGAAIAASVTSNGSARPRTTTTTAATLTTDLDVQALWTQLSAMPASDRDNVVAGLSPDARGQLRAYAQEIAIASENR